MHSPEHGILCAGCPHRAAYLALKEATRRRRGHVICGNVGCTATGEMYPAAATCPGGMEKLLPRYRYEVPAGGTPDTPACPVCVHLASDVEIAADDAPNRFANLAAEGKVTILAALASTKRFLARDAIEKLGARMLELGADTVAVLDPFDAIRCAEELAGLLDAPGVHGVIFASPCTQLQRAHPLDPVEVDPYMCVGCHRCFQITACPALSFAPPVYTVDPERCAGCDLCCNYCRTQVIYSSRARMTPAERSRARYAACE